MPDDSILRRIVEQAQGQGGPAFANRMPSIQERTRMAQDPALALMAQREGMDPADYVKSIDPRAAEAHRQRIERNAMMAKEPQGDGMTFPTQADLDQRYQQQQMMQNMPPVPSMGQPPAEGQSPQIGLDSPVARPPVPRNPIPDAGSTMEAGATMDRDPFLTTGSMGGRMDAPPPLPVGNDAYLTTGMSGAYRTDSEDGLLPQPPAAGLSYGNEPMAGTDLNLTYGDTPNTVPATAPMGQVIPGQPGSVQNAPIQSGLAPVSPTDPEAYDSETGQRTEDARKLSLIERMFGEKGSDRANSSGKALMMAGAAIMSTPGSLGQAIGAGIQQGLMTYDDAQKALADEAKEARQMGMEDEAHALDMELKRIAIERGRRAGTLSTKVADAKPDKIQDAITMAARLTTELGLGEEDARNAALGAVGITSRYNAFNRAPDPFAEMFE